MSTPRGVIYLSVLFSPMDLFKTIRFPLNILVKGEEVLLVFELTFFLQKMKYKLSFFYVDVEKFIR